MIKKSDIISKHVGKIYYTRIKEIFDGREMLIVKLLDKNNKNITLYSTFNRYLFFRDEFILHEKIRDKQLSMIQSLHTEKLTPEKAAEQLHRFYLTQDYYGKELTLYKVKYKDIELIKFLPENHEVLND